MTVAPPSANGVPGIKLRAVAHSAPRICVVACAIALPAAARSGTHVPRSPFKRAESDPGADNIEGKHGPYEIGAVRGSGPYTLRP